MRSVAAWASCFAKSLVGTENVNQFWPHRDQVGSGVSPPSEVHRICTPYQEILTLTW
jgi:hypothetical protein